MPRAGHGQSAVAQDHTVATLAAPLHRPEAHGPGHPSRMVTRKHQLFMPAAYQGLRGGHAGEAGLDWAEV